MKIHCKSCWNFSEIQMEIVWTFISNSIKISMKYKLNSIGNPNGNPVGIQLKWKSIGNPVEISLKLKWKSTEIPVQIQ